MRLHPVDIAKELTSFHFFRNFPQDLLLQVSTLVEAVSFKKGDVILKEGETNKTLYFLRKGHAEVMLAGETVALLQNPGEVIGEMSVVTERPVSTSIVAGSDIEAFKINTDNFNYVSSKEKDHFLHLLYRIYSNILAERLVKTNEKARLFEIANRELHQAQMSLDSAGSKSVLLVELDKKQLALARVALGSTGVQLDTASEVEAAKAKIQEKAYDAIIVDQTCLDFLRFAHDQKTASRLIMMTNKDVSQNLKIYKDMGFVETLMTRDPEDRNFTIRTILTTLSKVLNCELFGLEKYLTWGVEVKSKTVKASTEREQMRDEMCAYFKKLGIRSTILERLNAVAEEMLMNAIYDAPVDSHGKALYNHLPRRTEIILESHLQASLRYATDGVFVAVSVTDPFGALSKEIILKYLESCYGGVDQPTEHDGKGGAGKGLHQIVENADLTVFNVKRGVKTEVICLFYVEGHKKEPQPSFHYFYV